MAFGGSVSVTTLPHTHNQSLTDDGGQLSETLTDMNGVTLYSLITGAGAGTETHEFTSAETWTPTAQTGIMNILIDTTTMTSGIVNITIDGVLTDSINTATTLNRLYDPSSSITIETTAPPPLLLEQTLGGTDETFSDVNRVGQQFVTGSSLIGETITKVLVRLKIKTGSPTGTITCTVRDSADTIKLTLGTSAATSLTGSFQDVEYENLTGVTIADQDKVCIEYPMSLTNNISVEVHNSDVLAYSTEWYYTSSWNQRLTYDMYFKYYGIVSFSGTVLASLTQ